MVPPILPRLAPRPILPKLAPRPILPISAPRPISPILAPGTQTSSIGKRKRKRDNVGIEASKPQLPKKLRRHKSASTTADLTIDSEGSALKETATTSTIVRSRKLAYLQGLRETVQALRADPTRPPTVGEQLQDNLDALFAAPAQRLKTWTVLSILTTAPKSNSAEPLVEIWLHSSLQRREQKKLGFRLPPHGIGQLVKDKPEVGKQVANLLEHFMNAWPFTTRPGFALKQQIVTAAYAKIGPGSKVQVRCPVWQKKSVRLVVPYVDEKTGDYRQYEPTAGDGRSLTRPLPDLPSNVDLVYVAEHLTVTKPVPKNSAGEWESLLPPDEQTQPRLDQEKLLRFASFRLAGLRSTPAKMHHAMNRFLRLYTTGTKGGLQGAFHLRKANLKTTGVIKSPTSISLILRRWASQETGMEINKIYLTIQSPDVNWALRAGAAGFESYAETYDVLEEILVVAEMVDLSNQQIREGERPPSSCFCDTETKKSAMHPCGCCGRATMCEGRSRNWAGLWVCPKCFDDEKDVIALNKTHTSNGVRRNFARELTLLGLDLDQSDQEKKRLDDAVEDVWSQLKDCDQTEYRDQYTAQKVTIPSSFTPLQPSIDAIHPYMRLREGDLRNHVKGNLAVTAVALNMAKYRHLVGVLAEIASFRRQMQRTSDPVQLSQARHNLIARCHEMHVVAIKQSFVTKSRLERPGSTSEEAFLATRQEWVSGKLGSGDTISQAKWQSQINRCLSQSATVSPCGWDEEARQDILSILGEIEDHFQVNLDRSHIDGAPSFGESGTMPDDWSWNLFWSLCDQRYWRLRYRCNRHWATVESHTGIACELLYQACSDEEEYTEFLRLPIVVRVRDPLNVSIGHKNHGMQMRTGWPRRPKKLSDRNNAHNNILIETQFSNMIKLDYDSATEYASIRKLVDDINIPKSMYDPGAPAPTAPTLADEVAADTDLELPNEEPMVLQEISDRFIAAYNAEDDQAEQGTSGVSAEGLGKVPTGPSLTIVKDIGLCEDEAQMGGTVASGNSIAYGWIAEAYDGEETAYGYATDDKQFVVGGKSSRKNEVLATWDDEGEVRNMDGEVIANLLLDDLLLDDILPDDQPEGGPQKPPVKQVTISATTLTKLQPRLVYGVQIENAVDSHNLAYHSVVSAGHYKDHQYGYPNTERTYVTEGGEVLATIGEDGAVYDTENNFIGSLV